MIIIIIKQKFMTMKKKFMTMKQKFMRMKQKLMRMKQKLNYQIHIKLQQRIIRLLIRVV